MATFQEFQVTQKLPVASRRYIYSSTDKRNPTLYANGKVYGADRTGGGRLWVLDPVKNTVNMYQVQPRITKGYSTKLDYYHDRAAQEEWIASPHNPMLDEQGRVWLTEPVRPPNAEYYPKWAKSAIASNTCLRQSDRTLSRPNYLR